LKNFKKTVKNKRPPFWIFSGNSNPRLTRKISEYLKTQRGEARINTFSDGEIQIEVEENVRNIVCYIVQSTCQPNDNLVELLLMIDAFKRASASKIVTVIPYFGYARQDKKVQPRVPISAKLIASLLETAGASKIITMDLHAEQIQGFFETPVDNLSAMPELLKYVKKNIIPNGNKDNSVIISPDVGGAQRARGFAKRLNADLAIIDKRRTAPSVAKAMTVIGNVKDKIAIIYDDMVDTAGTLIEATNAVIKEGAKEIHACATHPVFSGSAIDKILNSKIKTMIVSNTIPFGEKAAAHPEKFKIVSVANTIGEAIIRDFNGESVTSLFV